MSLTERQNASPTAHGQFRHEALLYAGDDGFLDGSVPFLREGLARGEEMLVVVDAGKIAALRAALGGDSERVQFADMALAGRNPARIIDRWQRFVADHLRPDRPVRGIGEPIWAARSAAELVECQAHETLLNLAFADSPAWTLRCPYDVTALRPDVIAEARRSHPVTVHDGVPAASTDYLAEHPSPARFDHPLPPPPADAVAVDFGPEPEALRAVRALVAEHARRAGLGPATTEKIQLAANEVATNTLCHGGGRGTLRLWSDGPSLICEISDAGHIDQHRQPLLGRAAPTPHQPRGRGLWLVNQLCDLVQLRSAAGRTTVRMWIS